MFKNILVASDGSEFAGRAVVKAAQLAKTLQAKLTMVWVAEPYSPQVLAGTPYPFVPVMSSIEFEQQCRDIAERLFSEAKDIAAAQGVTAIDTVRENSLNTHKGILTCAENIGADLLVMASHGRRGISALFLGSETQKVLAHSEIPVLVVR